MSKNNIKYEDFSQDNQETVYDQSSQDDFNQDYDYGEEGEQRNELLELAERVGDIIGTDSSELLIKTIIKAAKSRKMERIGRRSLYAILYIGRERVLEIYQHKRLINSITLDKEVIDQLRQYV